MSEWTTKNPISRTKAAMNVHNVISGRIWIDMVGEVKIVAHATGETAKFRLARAGKAEKRGKIEGEICDARGVRAAIISGNTTSEVWARPDPDYVPPPGGETLSATWTGGVGGGQHRGAAGINAGTGGGGGGGAGGSSAAAPPPPPPSPPEPLFRWNGLAEDAARQYGFTAFAITLNELTPEMLQNLPPTDSRLRPDMRALEEAVPVYCSLYTPQFKP